MMHLANILIITPSCTRTPHTVLLYEIQSRHSCLRRAPFRSPVFAGLGLRNARRVLEECDDWIPLSSTVESRVHENQSVQLGWVAVMAEFRDYIILVM